MRLTIKITLVFLTISVLLYGYVAENTPETIKPENFISEIQAVKIAVLPKQIKESSGLEEAGEPGTFYTHNDANNPPELFKIDQTGKLLNTIALDNIQNIDWEDLTRDNSGHIYIGDFGNNSNKRKRLKIYKLNPAKPDEVEELAFEYADRKAGKADKDHYEFDCEAMFWYRSKIFLIIKDRSNAGLARLYSLPDRAGEHEAMPIAQFAVNAPVTSADISPDSKTLILLSLGKLHLFRLEGERNFFGSDMKTLDLGKVGQTEAAVFTDNKTIVLTSEEGDMYRVNL